MSRYITTKADFTLRRKHKKGSGTTIYENDYTTINPMPNALKGEYVIGDSNFVFTSRLGINGQKKHVRNKFVPPSDSSLETKIAWTIENMPDSGITDETKIRLKPNYTSIKDFACYGSAVKLIQGTVNGVITDFPAEMYLSNETITFYDPEENCAGYSFNEEKSATTITGKVLYNEYAIDITTKSIQPESVYNPMRFFALCGSSYTYIEDENEFDFLSFSSETIALGECYDGKSVWIDKVGDITLVFSGEAGTRTIHIAHFKDYRDGSEYYMYSGVAGNSHIRPKREIVEDYFRNCDDFTAVLLDRTVKPIYTSTFETPRETETRYVFDMVKYNWPSSLGGYNPDLSNGYYAYLDSLMQLAEFYDEFFSDNMWRSLTHEAIKTLDWTYISNSDGDIQDMSTIDTSRIEPITKIYGRQFDDLKRYADGIKRMNTITYNQKSNMPDYMLTDALENSGWEVKTLKITNDKGIRTTALYPAHTSGYTASDTNNEILRRLKLNSRYLFSVKGTRKGLDAMLGMFGFKPEEYDIHEYVYVFSSDGEYTHFCEDTEKIENLSIKYPLAKDVATINKYKVNFNIFDPYGDYCGIPVTEVGCWKDGKDCSYVIPWYTYGKKYDDGLYFQMNGGWGKRKHLEVNLDIAPGVTEITDMDGEMPLYLETQTRLKFASDFDDLLQEAYTESHLHDVFYVTDISDITTAYSSGETDDISDCSHYFVLENESHNQFLGYSEESGKYGWRSISNEEIQSPESSTAGTLVLYLESIKDITDGNNPHVGNGTYDGGAAYIESMSHIFNDSLNNRNFIGIDDETCSAISKYAFDVEEQEDNRKCWFFSDNNNSVYGKTVVYNTPSGKPEKEEDCGEKVIPESSEKIEFREVDITDKICHCDDNVISSGRCTEFADFDIEELLETASTNAANIVGQDADTYFYNEMDEVYTRTTKLKPFDPEGEDNLNGEAAANSIVNVKKLVINFNLTSFLDACIEKEPDLRKKVERYIETSVIPYLEQMIPSTAILEWTYTFGDTVYVPVTATFTQEPKENN